MFEGSHGARPQKRAMAVPKRFRLSIHIALTMVAFVTIGRPPRLPDFGPRDLVAVERDAARNSMREFVNDGEA